MRQHQRRTLHPLNHIRHRKRLARTRHTQQHLRPAVVLHSRHQRLNRLRLVASRSKLAVQLELLVHLKHYCPAVCKPLAHSTA